MSVARVERVLRCWCWWTLAVLAPGSTADAAVSVRTAWVYRAPDLQPNTLFPSSCASPDGRLLVLATAHRRFPGADVAVLFTPDGEARRLSFPEVTSRKEKLDEGLRCSWVDDDEVVVVARTSTDALIAAWFSADFALHSLLDVAPGLFHGFVPLEFAAISREDFVLVGMRDDRPSALRFNRQRASTVTLPWPDELQGWLKDVVGDDRGGFAVCGVEKRGAEGQDSDARVLVAAFDTSGAVRAQTRLEGRVCRFLPDQGSKRRLLHDDGDADRLSLLLTTLESNLEIASEEELAKPAGPHVSMPAVVVKDRIFFVNNFYAFETLEIRGPSYSETLDLDISAGQFADLQPGPSRVYLISATAVPPGATGLDFGLRVDALIIEDE